MTPQELEFDLAAKAEGWAIFDCNGSENGRYQICRIDDLEAWEEPLGFIPPQLKGDHDAWRIVMQGIQPHHNHARKFIERENPLEWNLMLAFTAKE